MSGITDPVVRHCPSCGVDVSVPGDLADPRCPTCAGDLSASVTPARDASSETLLEVRRESEDETFFDPMATPPTTESEERRRTDAVVSRGAARARDAVDDLELGDTETFPGGQPLDSHRLGPFRLVRVLGKGGMGVVYEAVHTELGRTVALKVMTTRGGEAAVEELERFKREARAAAKLRHPNIIPVLEVGEDKGQHYFTMELVTGKTLQALARGKELTPERSCQLMAKVARAIHYAHEAGVLHRDLKPSNIIVDESGDPHVMDFGLAKDLNDVSGLTMTGVAMGSPPYMPPEQARGEFRHVDQVSDVYGLGASLYECLAGRAPFSGKSLYDIIAKVLVEDPKPPSQTNPEVPYDLETICLKALEKEKWRRYPSALDFARDLDRFTQGASIRARRQGLTTRVGRYLVRNRAVIVAVLVPMAVVAALAVYAFGREDPPATHVSAQEAPHRGPIAEAGNALGTLSPERALQTLAQALPQRPLRDTVQAEIGRLPASRFGPLSAALGEMAQGKAKRIEAKALSQVLTALATVPAHDLPREDLEQALSGLFSPDDPWARLVHQAVLAHRAANDSQAWSAVFDEEHLSPLDLHLIRAAAARQTGPLARRFAKARDTLTKGLQSRLPDLPPQVHQLASGRIVSRPPAGSAGWTFPHVALPEEDVELPPLRGESGSPLPPAPPVLSPDARRVAVAWLRFVYLLDAASGRVLTRRRLPGPVAWLDHAPQGGYRVGVQLGAELETLTLGADLELEGRHELLRRGAWRDQAWRVACALVPEFEEAIEVRSARAPPEGQPSRSRWIRYPLSPGRAFDLGFRQSQSGAVLLAPFDASPEERTLATVLSVGAPVMPKSAVGKALLQLYPVDPPKRRKGPPAYVGHSELFLRFEGSAYRTYRPSRELSPKRWASVASRIQEHLAHSDDPNPWLLAFHAAALRQSGHDAPEVARTATLSPHLDPRGRVHLACFLDLQGYEAACDEGLARALRELWSAGPYLPEWAGYGELDLGRLVADRIDRCTFEEDRWARAQALVPWRNALAPALREGTFARRALRQAKLAPGAEPKTTAPSLPAQLRDAPPPKGLAGLSALSLARADHAMRIQPRFHFVLILVLFALMVRYRRHAIRDLDRLGICGWQARLKMWVKQPMVRLHYTLPAYFNLQDKLALIAVYVVFFSVFAVQEASVRIVLAARSAPQALVGGAPGEPAAARHLLAAAANGNPQAIYALAWTKRARGEDPGSELMRVVHALGIDSPRAQLLWAECQPPERQEAALATVRRGERLGDHLLLAQARATQDHVAIRAAEERLSETSAVWAGYRWAKAQGAEPGLLPAAPPPTADDRDVILFNTTHWSRRLPSLLLLNLLGLQPADAWQGVLSDYRFEQDSNVSLARYHNDWFFLVPMGLLLMLALLFVKTPHRFEPLPDDLAPSWGVRIWRLLVPGMPQYQTGRPLRGVLLMLPWLYLGQELVGLVGSGRAGAMAESLYGFQVAEQLAHLTGDVASALPLVNVHHAVELVLILGVIYVLHWVDLALAQRKVFQRDEAERTGRQREPAFVIPIDSVLDSQFAAPNEVPRASGEAPGPFDTTEASIPAAPPTERTELDLTPPRTPPQEGTQADG